MTDIATRLANLQLPTITPVDESLKLALRRADVANEHPQFTIVFDDGSKLGLELYNTDTSAAFTVSAANPWAFSQVAYSTLLFIRGQMTRTQLINGDDAVIATEIDYSYFDDITDPANPVWQQLAYPAAYGYYDRGVTAQTADIPYA